MENHRRPFAPTPLAALALAVLAAVLAGGAAQAQLALAVKAGTLGAGLEVTGGLNPHFNLRLGLNRYDYSSQRKESGIDYDAKAQLRNSTLLVDWYPLWRGFHLTGGLVRNDNVVDGRSRTPGSGVYVLGGVPVPASQVGTLRAGVDFDPQVPYAGLGWGNPINTDGRLSFYLDLGVVFQGKPRVGLAAEIPAGSPLNNPVARQALEVLLQAEARDIEDDLKSYDKYPVVALGLAYRF
jgi:hypothetical protein